MPSDLLLGPVAVPAFARLHEYFGCWAHEPDLLVAQLRLFQRADLFRHALEARTQPPPAATTSADVVDVRGTNVGVVRVEGVLMKGQPFFGGTSTAALRGSIRQLAADQSVSSILLRVSSPGGTVAGTHELAAEVKAARKRKPVWAQIEDFGASAAYWVSSQADQVYANVETAQAGGIGTVMAVPDMSKAAERDGVEVIVFKTGPLKGAGIPGSVVDEGQRAHFQGIVDGVQASFDAAVRQGRGLSAEQLEAVRTGGMFLAPRAKQLGLIDGVRPLEATLTELAKAR